MRGLIVDYCGVLDGENEDRESWRGLFAELREVGIALAILSNDPGGPAADPIRKDAQWYGIDTVLLSGETRIEKPEEEAFLGAAAAIGLDARECVLVDDSIVNVHAAVQAGLIGVFYQAFERSEVEVRSIFGLEN